MNERVVIERPGNQSVLRIVQEGEPVPKRGEVKVRILATGVAFADVMLRRGIGVSAATFPVTPGRDFVGVVEENGTGSARYAVGDRVAGAPIRGANQRFVCFPRTS